LKKHPAVLTKCAEWLPSCFLQGMSTLTNCRNLSKAWCATTRSHLLLEVNTRGRAKVHGAAQSVHQVHYAESVSSIAAEPLQQIADWGWFFSSIASFEAVRVLEPGLRVSQGICICLKAAISFHIRVWIFQSSCCSLMQLVLKFWLKTWTS
jgi:hypothetical protein